MAKQRIFAAIDISDEARSRVGAYMRTQRSEFGYLPVRWESLEKLHVTINFAGNLDSNKIPAFVKQVAGAARAISPFEITIAGTGAFTKHRSHSNVLWLGLESNPSNALEHLAALVSTDSQSRFKPHLTIARIKDREMCQGLIERHLASEFRPIEFTASEVVVYESRDLSTGSVYTAISRHRFRKPGA